MRGPHLSLKEDEEVGERYNLSTKWLPRLNGCLFILHTTYTYMRTLIKKKKEKKKGRRTPNKKKQQKK